MSTTIRPISRLAALTTARQRLASMSRGALGLMVLLLAATHAASAQADTPHPRRWEFRLASGSLAPTGAGRDVIKPAQLSAAQLTWSPAPSLALSATFAWARSRDLGSVDEPKLDVFTSDVGVEFRSAQRSSHRGVTFSPFGGFGAGARSYNYRSLDVDARHNLAGYGAIGGEFAAGRAALRLEARSYVSGYQPLVDAGAAATHTDVVLLIALRFTRQRAAQR